MNESGRYAPPAVRDEFLGALDADDRGRSMQLAFHLTGCTNPLPGGTCIDLGLPLGSTYAAAAKKLLEREGSGKPAEGA